MLDNRNRDKSKELEEIEQEETPIDETKASLELREEQQKAPDDLADDETSKDDQEEEVNEEELDEAEKEDQPKESAPVVIKEEKKQDIEDRYRESTREAQILSERNKQLTGVIGKIDEVAEPNEEELRSAARIDGLDWDELTVSEKILIKKTYVSEQKLKLVQDAFKDIKDIDQYADKVDTYLEENETKQTNKALIGKETAFRSFAMKASHRGLPLDILASHFLMTAEPVAKKKGSMFLSPSTGQEAPKPKNVIDDADSAANLRITNNREYARRLKAGTVKIEV